MPLTRNVINKTALATTDDLAWYTDIPRKQRYFLLVEPRVQLDIALIRQRPAIIRTQLQLHTLDKHLTAGVF